MGTQNGSKLEIWSREILIHTLESKLRPFEVFPYVYTGKPCICNVSAHALREGRGQARTSTWRPSPFLSKLMYRLPACIVWLYYASSSPMWWFTDNFFCLGCGLLEKILIIAIPSPPPHNPLLVPYTKSYACNVHVTSTYMHVDPNMPVTWMLYSCIVHVKITCMLH